MDCEKFDEHVIDALYEELDELTAAALRRHTDGCARCAGILAGLKSAREGAVLPLEEPSDSLEARILDAERAAQKRAPWPRKLMRAAAWAGSHAMRPQLAMAALFMLVVGSSLLLLRARPGTVGAPVSVSDRGAPSPAATAAPDSASMRARGVRSETAPMEQRLDGLNEPKPAAAADQAAPSKSRVADNDQQAAAAASAAPGIAGEGAASGALFGAKGKDGPDTPQQALAWARDGRASGGCAEAVGRYNEVARRFAATPEADVANREASECQREVAAEAPAAPPPGQPAMMKKAAPPAKPARTDATGAAKPDASVNGN